MDIPNEAKILPKNCPIIPNIDEWFCPDCDATGDGDNIDLVRITNHHDPETDIVQYCCPQCFEENLYATFNKE